MALPGTARAIVNGNAVPAAKSVRPNIAELLTRVVRTETSAVYGGSEEPRPALSSSYPPIEVAIRPAIPSAGRLTAAVATVV